MSEPAQTGSHLIPEHTATRDAFLTGASSVTCCRLLQEHAAADCGTDASVPVSQVDCWNSGNRQCLNHMCSVSPLSFSLSQHQQGEYIFNSRQISFKTPDANFKAKNKCHTLSLWGMTIGLIMKPAVGIHIFKFSTLLNRLFLSNKMASFLKQFSQLLFRHYTLSLSGIIPPLLHCKLKTESCWAAVPPSFHVNEIGT